jgi:hypothetical protein
MGLGCPTGTILHGVKMRYFRTTGMIFPRLPLHLMEFEGIWGNILQLEMNKMAGCWRNVSGRP